MAGNTGWLPNEIDAMPLRRILDLLRYWGETPPVAESVAWHLGLRKPSQPANEPETPGESMSIEEAQAMVAQMNGD